MYVVKFTNSLVKMDDVIFQHRVLNFLRSSMLGKELQFPEPFPTKDGSSTCVEQMIGSKKYTMHILSYVEGQMFSDNFYFSSFSLMNFGRRVAQISDALKAFPHDVVYRRS
jgi:Ser/Thr protein kinase RdoA (MazF antagonist)